MTDRPFRKHTAVLRQAVTLAGTRVADIGCGDGALSRFMTREGAAVIGIECSSGQLERCSAAQTAGGESYLRAVGQNLPLADASLDLVVYFNSLHHVPVEAQGAALAEAARVLTGSGRLYVMEPLAEGGYFELLRPLEDETEVRATAYRALRTTVARGAFVEEQEVCYDAPFKQKSFADWRAYHLAVDPRRATALAGREREFARGFERLAERREGAYWFVQPSRLNLLRRA